ncbi:hypothetical protein [Robiginitalea marina]|uniref:Uncharacterized protein n=1 Tax=Robiginitalea marina TaxID=2954105 RepID=A0ABT1B0P9_9FLAO|nr:hypothetical protein [Robiginitalea marina]MCO5725420.1 hypothetical protein [Robiginitalea marina]
MKTMINTCSALPRVFWLALAFLLALPTAAQDKKERLRVGAVYTKIMEGPVTLDLSTSARIDRSNVNVPDIDLEVYYEVDGEEFPLGTVRTDQNGNARLTLENLGKIQPDSTGLYILGASFAGNEMFTRASKSVEFRDAAIRATLVEQDSLPYIEATLADQATDSLVADALIKVQVKRMFKPLRISEDLLMTDEAGSILVPVPTDIPGKGGLLDIEVVIEDHESYGTVKALVEAPVGTPIAVDSTYDERTLWARSSRTPIFILVFTGLLVFGSWGLIVYLIFNLFKIAKTKYS